MPDTFDLIVVGTGTGLDVAAYFTGAGWRVAVVEKGEAGGTCLNRGCIPSKMLIHSADVARTLRKSHLFGLHHDGFTVDFPSLMRRVREHVDGESTHIRDALRAAGDPAYYEGHARFVSRDTLRVGEREIRAPKILLATGARPAIPDVPGLRDVPFLTSTEALALPELPESMVVLGGGYIAAELGHFYGSLGTRVSILQKHERLLPREDEEIGEAFTRAFARQHDVRLGATTTRVRKEGEGILLELRRAGRREEIRAQKLLVVTGITPNSDTLDLAKAGVRTDARGFIDVDATLATNVPGIWALGDAIGRYAFKHAANHEARYLIHNLANPEDAREVDYHAMPHAIFSDPQVAGVGATEQELRLSGVEYRVARQRYHDTAMGKALAEDDGFVKLLVEPDTERILGAHILGPEASTLIHQVLAGMRSGTGTLADIRETIHIHPALSEVVQRAASALD